MKVYKCLMSIILTICIAIGSFGLTTIRSNAEGERVIIKASEIKTKTSQNYTYNASEDTVEFKLTPKDIELIMDADLEISFILCNQNDGNSSKDNHILYISGSKKLTVKEDLLVTENLVLESGTNIKTATLTALGNVTIKSGANVEVDCTKLQNPNIIAFMSYGDVNLDGNVTVKSGLNAIYAGGVLSINGGEIHTDGTKASIVSNKKICINGGNLYCHSSEKAIYSFNGYIEINGGYIESVVDEVSIDLNNINEVADIKANFISGSDGITIKDSMYVNEPSSYSLKTISFLKANSKNAVIVVDGNGKIPNKVIISNKKSAGNSSKDTKKYSSEWVDGKWYNADGSQSYQGTLQWKSNSTGWWVEDSSGWYPVSQWQKIDGKWYYFLDSGYMDYSEYRDGCWLGSDGAWVEEYYGGHWCSDSKGWWYEDSSGWYPQSQYLWIDGVEYWFNSSGYMS